VEAEEPVNLDGPIVDTNVVVRFLRDQESQHQDAVGIFEKAAAEKRRLVLLDVIVAESIFVLSKTYGLGRLEVAEAMEKILDHPAIGVATPDILREALAKYATTRLHFVDCYLMAVARPAGRRVVTFDKGIGNRGNIAH
jgi:predicted nucleic-acid-binding protein